MEEQIILSIQKLIESGALDKINTPDAQSAIIYGLLIVLAAMLIKYVVLNGMVKRFFDFEELKVKELQSLNKQLRDVQEDIKRDHTILQDVLKGYDYRRDARNYQRRSDDVDA